MKTSIALLAGLLALSTVPAMATTTCLRSGQIDTWRAINDRTIVVQDNSHNKFKLKLIGMCQQLNYKDALTFKTIGGGSPLTCISRGDEIITHDFGMPHDRQTCSIVGIEPFTGDMPKNSAH